LYFGRRGDKQAVVLSDGQIKYGENSGSIHKVGRDIQKSPCNGWLAWYYIEQVTGNLKPIDQLRQNIRRQIQQDSMMIDNYDEES
jgi:modification methylase